MRRIILIVVLIAMLIPTNAQNEEGWIEQSIIGLDESITYSHPAFIETFEAIPNYFDLIQGHANGLIWLPNTHEEDPTSLVFQSAEVTFFPQSLQRVNQFHAPTVGDFDNDGDNDILSGNQNGTLNLWLRNGIEIHPNSTLVSGIKVSSRSKPTMCDLNGDKIIDIIIGSGDGSLTSFINTNNVTHPTWEEHSEYFSNIHINFAAPSAIDPDNDGIYDLVVGSEKGSISFLKNTGTLENPVFEEIPQSLGASPFNGLNIDEIEHSTPFLFDIDNDDFLDLFIGSKSGEIYYFLNRNIDLANVEVPFLTGPQIAGLVVILITSVVATAFIVRRRGMISGNPVFLMVVHSIGISPFKYQFTDENVINDLQLASGAFTGVQNIITEITGAPELKALDAGENKILISRHKFKTMDTSVDILLWATADDPKLRAKSLELAKMIAEQFEDNFGESRFDENFTLTVNRWIAKLFKEWM